MPDDFIPSLESRLSSESDKKAAFEQAVGEDIYAQVMLFYLEDQCAEDTILATEGTRSTEEINGCKFKSVEEIINYLKQAADDWHSNQLSRIAREHDYISSSNPSGRVHNLRVRTGNRFNRGCTCCNGR